MARRTIVELTDDLDGGQADETLYFAVDGINYEIDLSSNNADKFRSAVDPFVEAARKANTSAERSTRTRGRGRQRSDRAELATIREWARHNGHQVSDRGRIPGTVVAAYQAATGG
jgi:5'-3' exonuclease